jgi:hypothetical protein
MFCHICRRPAPASGKRPFQSDCLAAIERLKRSICKRRPREPRFAGPRRIEAAAPSEARPSLLRKRAGLTTEPRAALKWGVIPLVKRHLQRVDASTKRGGLTSLLKMPARPHAYSVNRAEQVLAIEELRFRVPTMNETSPRARRANTRVHRERRLGGSVLLVQGISGGWRSRYFCAQRLGMIPMEQGADIDPPAHPLRGAQAPASDGAEKCT